MRGQVENIEGAYRLTASKKGASQEASQSVTRSVAPVTETRHKASQDTQVDLEEGVTKASQAVTKVSSQQPSSPPKGGRRDGSDAGRPADLRSVIRCPECGEKAYSTGPLGAPQRQCYRCDHTWTPS